jgi:hypothetical protein
MRTHSLSKTIICAAIATVFSSTVSAGSQAQWNGSENDQWTNANNWDGSLPPQAGGDALVTDLLNPSNTSVTYTNPGDLNPGSDANPLNSVVVDGAVASDMRLNQGTDKLSTDTLTLGNDGTGIYGMTGGTLNVLHNDAFTSTFALGVNDGSVGTFNQDGGDVFANHNITLGQNGGSEGIYNLNTGTLNVNGFITLSFEGIGTINQRAGTTNTVASDIYMGGTNGTYNLYGGDLLVQGGQGLIVGTFSTGTFNQTGGTNTSTYLSLGGAAGSNGTYNLSNGSLQVTHDAIIGHGESDNNFGTGSVGTFQQTGGTNQVGGDLILGQTGVFLAGDGTYNLKGGSLAVTGSVVLGASGDPVSGTGTFNQDNSQGDSTHTVGGNLVLGKQAGSTGVYTLTDQLNSNAAPSLTVSGDTIIGQAGAGTFNQNGGTHTTNNLVVGSRSDGTSSYVMSGGDLAVNGRMFVGLGHDAFSPDVVNGLFQQSAGTVTAAQIYIGGFPDVIYHTGTGRYELSGDGVVNSAVTEVGRSGNGQVQQTGGIFNAGALQLGSDGLTAIDNGSGGFNFYSSGTYNLQAGQLNTTSTVVSVAGLGTINQSGAASQHNVSGDLVVGSFRTAVEPISGQVNEGKYNLSDGTLAVQGNSIIGAGNNDAINFPDSPGGRGTFTQTGGAYTVTGDLIVGQEGSAGLGAGGTGAYDLSAGTLDVSDTLRLSQNNSGAVGGNATFVQNGGVVTASGFDQEGNNGASSSYTLNGGTLNSGGFGSMSDSSVFNQTGGTHNNTSFFDIGNSGGSNYNTVYNITGATADANFTNLTVGGFGIGIMNQSNGVVNATGQIVVGDGPNVDPTRRYGEYNLSGGALNAKDSLVIGAGNGVNGDPGFPGEPGGLGTFKQTSGDVHVGTNSVPGDLVVGASGSLGGGSGTYTLNNGNLTVAGISYVGGNGVNAPAGGTINPSRDTSAIGIFNQSGGLHSTTTLDIGTANNSHGTYNLDGGILNATNLTVGDAGIGDFKQAGGSNAVTNTVEIAKNVGAAGSSYSLSGGSLAASNMDVDAGGTLNYTGGSLSLDSGSGTLTNAGQVDLSGAGTRTVDANVVNNGNFKVTDTTVSYTGSFTNNGGYHSDPSTNLFTSLTVGLNGYLTGGLGDVFQMQGNYFNQSTQYTLWDTSKASLEFTGAVHQMETTGAFGNFTWGSFILDHGAGLNLNGILTVGLFDLMDGLNQLNSLSGTFDIYYDKTLAGNAYLLGQDYTVGNGRILAYSSSPSGVPEPATWSLLIFGLSGWCLRRRRM